MQSYLTASQIRACTCSSRKETHWERHSQQGPCTGWNALTLKTSAAARLPLLSWARKVSSFLQLKTDHRELYEDVAFHYQHGMCAEQSFNHSDWLVWFCPSDQGHPFSRQWPGFGMNSAAVTGPRYMPTWDGTHALNLISFKPHTEPSGHGALPRKLCTSTHVTHT